MIKNRSILDRRSAVLLEELKKLNELKEKELKDKAALQEAIDKITYWSIIGSGSTALGLLVLTAALFFIEFK
jgi:hypothetical protein